jgi:hypothetical protein
LPSRFCYGYANTLSNSKTYVIEPKGFMGYPVRGSACELSSYGHEQCFFDNPNQNN